MHFLFSISQELPTHSCPSIRVKESREDSKPHIILPHFKVAFFSIREFLVEIFWVRKKWVAIPLFHHHTTVKICNEFRQDWDSNDHSFWIGKYLSTLIMDLNQMSCHILHAWESWLLGWANDRELNHVLVFMLFCGSKNYIVLYGLHFTYQKREWNFYWSLYSDGIMYNWFLYLLH